MLENLTRRLIYSENDKLSKSLLIEGIELASHMNDIAGRMSLIESCETLTDEMDVNIKSLMQSLSSVKLDNTTTEEEKKELLYNACQSKPILNENGIDSQINDLRNKLLDACRTQNTQAIKAYTSAIKSLEREKENLNL